MSIVTCEQQDDIAVITLDDGKANAMSPDMIAAVNAALDQAEKDAKVALITGRPGVLSGGFDLKIIRSGDAAATTAMVTAGARLLMRIYGFSKPVVIATAGHGVALGGFLLLTADYRLGVTGDFKIGLNEVAIGMTVPPFGMMLANARLAPNHMCNAVLNANLYNPAGASAVGFLDEVVEPGHLMTQALARANTLAQLDGSAFARTKQDIRGAAIQRILGGLDSA